MTVEKIPFPYSFDDCNPRYRLLHQVNTMFKSRDEPMNFPPLFKLMSIMKERFCSSCSLRCLDNEAGQSDSIGIILEDMRKLLKADAEQDYITGYHSSTDETFLAINLPTDMCGELKESFVLILWRKGRIFTPEDVIVARTCLILFFSLFKEKFKSKISLQASLNTFELLSRASDVPEAQINPQNMSFLYGEALDMVCKCVVITNKDGTLIHMNKCAETLFKRPLASDEMIQSYEGGIDWFAGLLHPDDLQSLVSTWNTGLETSEGFTVEFRLQISEGKTEYHLFRCMSHPIKDTKTGNVQFWIFCMFDMEMARLMEETKLAAGRKTKFLAEMSHGKRACFIDCISSA